MPMQHHDVRLQASEGLRSQSKGLADALSEKLASGDGGDDSVGGD